jgi:hypothetical protein
MKPRRAAKLLGRPYGGKDAFLSKSPSPSATSIFRPMSGSLWAYYDRFVLILQERFVAPSLRRGVAERLGEFIPIKDIGRSVSSCSVIARTAACPWLKQFSASV